jgi:hypothetical protein
VTSAGTPGAAGGPSGIGAHATAGLAHGYALHRPAPPTFSPMTAVQYTRAKTALVTA